MNILKKKLTDHSASHKNDLNVKLHMIGIPGTFFSVIGLFSLIPIPNMFKFIDFGLIICVLAMIYYLQFGIKYFLAMIPFYSLFYIVNKVLISKLSFYPYILFIIVLTSSILLFLGHKIENSEKSSTDDVLNSLIGPLWFTLFIFNKKKLKKFKLI